MKGVEEGWISPHHLAYLIDRIQVNTGGLQYFGTQVKKENGKAVPKPLFDEENVNLRRRCYSLGEIEKYLQKMEKK